MPALELLHRIVVKLAASHRAARLTCGDCERNARCGRLPHQDCVPRAMQTARDGDEGVRSSAMVAYPGVWPV